MCEHTQPPADTSLPNHAHQGQHRTLGGRFVVGAEQTSAMGCWKRQGSTCFTRHHTADTHNTKASSIDRSEPGRYVTVAQGPYNSRDMAASSMESWPPSSCWNVWIPNTSLASLRRAFGRKRVPLPRWLMSGLRAGDDIMHSHKNARRVRYENFSQGTNSNLTRTYNALCLVSLAWDASTAGHRSRSPQHDLQYHTSNSR